MGIGRKNIFVFFAFLPPISFWIHVCVVLLPLSTFYSGIICDYGYIKQLKCPFLLTPPTVPVYPSHLKILPFSVCCFVFVFPSLGAQEQPMEELYEELVIKIIKQEWTCLDFQQLPCSTVMEDMPRM